MGGGPKNVTSTTNTEPPKWAVPYLQQGMRAAGQQYSGGGGAGANLIPSAQGLVQNTINGQFLSPDTNPYLEQTFNRGADAIMNRLNTDFASSGRDLGAGRPAAADELGSFASQLYGNAYNFERGNQMSAIDQSQTLDPLNRFINQLAGLIPGAGGSTQSTQPVFRQGLFSDRRLKKNIKRVGEVKGLPWYSFEYIWGEKSEGFMADEVPVEFLIQDDVYKRVDYVALLGGE